jgi:hypothetical protein
LDNQFSHAPRLPNSGCVGIPRDADDLDVDKRPHRQRRFGRGDCSPALLPGLTVADALTSQLRKDRMRDAQPLPLKRHHQIAGDESSIQPVAQTPRDGRTRACNVAVLQSVGSRT